MSDAMVPRARILLADDDPASLLILTELLRPDGHECVCAEDAAAAKSHLEKSEFDLLISDIQMPGNRELEFIQDLPQLVNGLPVILVTAQPCVQTAMRSVRLAVTAYLSKPPEPEEFRSLVRQAVENYRAYRSLGASRRRLQDWVQDLEQIEKVLRNPPSGAMPEAISTLLSLNLRNLLESLTEMKQLTELLSNHSNAGEAARQLEGARPLVLVEAIHETIIVLEKTRTSFKSKELAELRRRLETLVSRG